MKNAINWFDIPVVDLDRAVQFYSALFDTEIAQFDMGGTMYATLPSEGEGVGGGLSLFRKVAPQEGGVLVYLNGGDDLSVMLSRVEAAGGKVEMPKTEIGGDNGYMATFVDTEGNTVGLQSKN